MKTALYLTLGALVGVYLKSKFEINEKIGIWVFALCCLFVLFFALKRIKSFLRRDSESERQARFLNLKSGQDLQNHMLTTKAKQGSGHAKAQADSSTKK